MARSFRRRFGLAILLGGLAGFAGCVHHHHEVVVEAAPPPAPAPDEAVVECASTPRVEVVPPRPAPQYVWIGGHWVRRGHRYIWVEGRWAIGPRPGLVWVPDRWVQTPRGTWFYQPGHWQ